jgi:hypothetical protein
MESISGMKQYSSYIMRTLNLFIHVGNRLVIVGAHLCSDHASMRLNTRACTNELNSYKNEIPNYISNDPEQTTPKASL